MTNNSNNVIEEIIKEIQAETVGITGSPSTTLAIALDISEINRTSRALGQMVFVWQEEDGRDILSLGQIVEVTTKNRWHEDPSFKGVIKRHGSLPHLSGAADNRLAVVSIQSSFDCRTEKPISHILGVSPTTGEKTRKMNNEVMQNLVKHMGDAVTYIGRIYGADNVDLPMYFKHFGDDEDGIPGLGAGDAYHIGVFGKTGSGKTVTAALMLLAYAKNNKDMNILVLDPQGQFAMDNRLLPDNKKFRDEIKEAGMSFDSYNLINKVFLPDETQEDLLLFARLLVSNNFIRTAFHITTADKQDAVADCIVRYLTGRRNVPGFTLGNQAPDDLLRKMLNRFLSSDGDEEDYIAYVYSGRNYQERLRRNMSQFLSCIDTPAGEGAMKKWREILGLYASTDEAGDPKTSVNEIVKSIIGEKKGKFIVLDMRPGPGKIENENMQALFLNVIEHRIAEAGGYLYAEGKMANSLIVMDEAHRYVNRKSPDERVRELSGHIIDAVRTTRKYGIGHMFITQSLESMDDEIIKQMRIFALGFGLTFGSEIRKIRELIDNQAALNLYKSFIDPGNRKEFPFMFSGPVSPLSATGAPLFVEIYNKYEDFINKNKDK